jgi:UDP-galactopyranose mutase
MSKMSKNSVLIVGAGLTGLTIGNILARAGWNIHIIDRRLHIGGNIYDEVDATGIRVHKYGPHIFHTRNARVVEFVKQFADWISYRHKVKAYVEGKGYFTFPPNDETRAAFTEKELIETFFIRYTEKMWATAFDRVDGDILKRLPKLAGMEDEYFPNDNFQGFPKDGYTAFAQRIADHDRITVHLNTAFQHDMVDAHFFTFNSMAIDEFFDYRYGRLPYRSIKFTNLEMPLPCALPVPTVNFTHTGPHTRVTEWKNYPGHGDNPVKTILTFEEPCSAEENDFEPFYPVKDPGGENRSLHRRYGELVDEHRMKFVGRCGSYAYLDMDQAINQGLNFAQQFLAKHTNTN